MAKTAMKEPGEPKKIPIAEPTGHGPSGDGAQTRYRNETREEFFTRHKMEPVEALLTNRRATWLAHAKRNKDDMMNRALQKTKILPGGTISGTTSRGLMWIRNGFWKIVEQAVLWFGKRSESTHEERLLQRPPSNVRGLGLDDDNDDWCTVELRSIE